MTCYFCFETIDTTVGLAEICESCFSEHVGFDASRTPEDGKQVGVLTHATYATWITETRFVFESDAAIKAARRAHFSPDTSLHPRPQPVVERREPLAWDSARKRLRPSTEDLSVTCALSAPPENVDAMFIRVPQKTGIFTETIKSAWIDSIGEPLPSETIEIFKAADRADLLHDVDELEPIISEDLALRMTGLYDRFYDAIFNEIFRTRVSFKEDGLDSIIEVSTPKPHFPMDQLQKDVTNLCLSLALPKARCHSGILEVSYKAKNAAWLKHLASLRPFF